MPKMQRKIKPRLFPYRVGVGYEGCVLESHIVWAKNNTSARSYAIRHFLHPDKGYNYISVVRLTKAQAEKEEAKPKSV